MRATSTPGPRVVVPSAYIVPSKVTHTRLLPTTATHTFAYPTLFVLVSLRALEAHALDLARGWLFGYGGIHARIAGLRATAYLTPGGEQSILRKLGGVLRERGLDSGEMEDAWMLTMTSYCGFEGINPLTVYFCYAHGGEPWVVVLEIHNTFGERHVHVLATSSAQDVSLPKGFTHEWTFPREFHVSPFNDRSGYYRVSVNMPTAPSRSAPDTPPPMPRVRVLLHTAMPPGEPGVGPLKLAAFLTPTTSLPWTSRNFLWSLLLQPFVLFVSTPRILYEAWRLHYRKGLCVYAKPDPRPVVDGLAGKTRKGGGVGWQSEMWAEAFARRRVEAFLRERVHETEIKITLIAGDPTIPTNEFSPDATSEETRHLIISYLSSAFFTALFTAPSFAHAWLLCQTSGCCHVSSEELFREVFSDTRDSDKQQARSSTTMAQKLRKLQLPEQLRQGRPGLEIPEQHAIDAEREAKLSSVATYLVLLGGIVSERVEAWVYWATGASFVAGQEPWRKWERVFGLEEPDEILNGAGSEYFLGSVEIATPAL
ncbi:DUF1365 domain-containing protein [Phanerochaete sordida]|uniref:DUF1365 domain-containing protein n=1 Tax=Phanerochaete sordida TaxID=48140 RepID=A0A9P3GDU7_9APHY|nr:DUF1365 domain-containing protein [Phanerochaete sordida]